MSQLKLQKQKLVVFKLAS